ncbi:MAG: hypothetical protein CL400_05940 [Acidiferrobacteraceae bacterium]|nr:hypothetical protein [Acidiferrobacteraceae bacterium]
MASVAIANAANESKTVQILSLESGFYDQSQNWVGGSAFRLAARADGTTIADFADPHHNFILVESWGWDYRIFTHGHSTNFIPIGASVPAKGKNGISGEINNAPLDWLGALQTEYYSEGGTNTDAFFQQQLGGEIRVTETAGNRYKFEDGNEFYFPQVGTELNTFGNWDELNLTPYADNPDKFLDSNVTSKGVVEITLLNEPFFSTSSYEHFGPLKVWIDPPGGGGIQATATIEPKDPTATWSGVGPIKIDNPGSGYTSPPKVQISGSSGWRIPPGIPVIESRIGTPGGFDGGKWPTIFDKHKTTKTGSSFDTDTFTLMPPATDTSSELKLAFKYKDSRERPSTSWETMGSPEYRGDPTSLDGTLPPELWKDYHSSFMFSERNFGHAYTHAKGLNVNFNMRTRDYHFGPQFSVEYSMAEPKEEAAPKWTESPDPAWDIDLDSARAELYNGSSIREYREDLLGNRTSYQFGDTYSYQWGYQRSVWLAGPDLYDGGGDDFAEAVGREEMSTTQTFPGGLKQHVAYITKNEHVETVGGTKSSTTNIETSMDSVTYQGAEFGATTFGTLTSTNVAPITMITKGPPVGKLPMVTNLYPTISVDLRLGISNFDIRLRPNVVKLIVKPIGLFLGLLKGAFNFVVTRVGAPGWALSNKLAVEVNSTKMEATFNEMKGSISVLEDDLDTLVVGNGIKAGVSDINNDVNTKLKAELTKIENKIAELDTAISNAEANTACVESAATAINSSLTHISAHALAASV